MNMPALKYSQIHQGLYTFINEDVLPTCGIELNVFWQAIENLIADYTRLPNAYIDQQSNQRLAANTKVVPVIDRQQLIQAVNSKWTSLFDMENAAQMSKDYLDQHFALASGSHADVQSYVVYYHHLLAFFEDGSQSGLAEPSQFVALCGHKCSPDSIVLKASSTRKESGALHTEVVFDKKGKRGSQDNAGIENILVETNETIVVDFNSMQIDGVSKIQAYRNLQSFLRGDLSTVIIENGQQKICRMSQDVTFTDLNGDDYCIVSDAPIQVRCANQSLVSELMRDNKGALAPQVIMDAVLTSIMLRNAQGALSESAKGSLLLSEGDFTSEMIQRVDAIFDLHPC